MYKQVVLWLRNIWSAEPVRVHDIISSKDKNNFNLLRLVASLAVIYDHSFALFNPDGVTHYAPFVSGYWAVNVFFFISGILITQSYFNSKSARRFWTMRIFRIWPALIVCILFTAVAVGPIVTELSPADYFSSPLFPKYFMNLALIRTKMFDHLPGVFAHNFYPDIVNGSLWTLPYEILCYIMVFIVLTAFTRIISNKKYIVNSLIVGTLIALIMIPKFVRDYLLSLWSDDALRRTFGFFGSGIITYFLSRRIRISFPALVVMVLITWSVMSWTNASEFVTDYLTIFTFMYGVLCIASLPFLYKHLYITNDYSYGIYIYAFLVQQSMANYLSLSPYQSMLISFPVTILFGVLSWHLIEKRALNFARKWSKKFKAASI